MAAVFMTDGFSTFGFELSRERARTMRYYGVEMFVVYVKEQTQQKSLHFLASKPTRNHTFELPNDTTKRNQVIDKLVEQICRGKYS